MSRKATTEVVSAFLARKAKQIGSTRTDGVTMYLHDNAIAEHVPPPGSGFVVTLAGWNTPTTRERLNALPGVSVSVKKGRTYLNGKPWNGEWTTVN